MRYSAAILLLIISCTLIECKSYDKNKYETNKKIIKDASRNEKLVSLKQTSKSGDAKDGYIGFVDITDSINGIFKFSFLLSKKSIAPLRILEDVDSVSMISESDKLKLSLPDNSYLVGSIVDANPERGNIIFSTQHHKYTIPRSKISKINYFNTNYVKVNFLDGSAVYGSIIGDDGDRIQLSTMFGNIYYSRDEINKIEYVQ